MLKNYIVYSVSVPNERKNILDYLLENASNKLTFADFFTEDDDDCDEIMDNLIEDVTNTLIYMVPGQMF